MTAKIHIPDDQIEVVAADDPVKLMLFNAERYPMGPFLLWSKRLSSEAARRSASLYPPNRIYEIRDTGDLCCVTGYAPSGKVAIAIPNSGPMKGIDPKRLKDVTEEVRAAYGFAPNQ